MRRHFGSFGESTILPQIGRADKIGLSSPALPMRVPAVYVTCALVWGTTWFAIRRCIGEGGYPTFSAAALRFTLATAVVGALYAAGYGRPGPRNLRQLGALAGCGVLCAAGYALVYAGEQTIPGGLAAVLYGLLPLLTAFFATVGGVEKVQLRAVIGALVALAGIALLFADRAGVSGAQALGVGLVLVSVVISALYTTILKRVAADVSSLAATGVFLGTSAVVLAVLALVVDRRPVPWPPPAGPTVALVYLALVGSVGVFAAYFYLLKRVRLMTASTLVLVEPVIALTVDAIWERDVALSGRSYVGIAVTIAGVALTVLGRR
jgi:drug/metabolite transporter (DMT)-like permease